MIIYEMQQNNVSGFTVLEAIVVVICVIILVAITFFILNP